jgi:hypothetical protein
VSYIHAGKYKVEGNPDQPLSAEGAQAIQQTVDDYYGQFVKAVSKARNVSETKVRTGYGEGRVLTAQRAVDAGPRRQGRHPDPSAQPAGRLRGRGPAGGRGRAAARVDEDGPGRAAAGGRGLIGIRRAGRRPALSLKGLCHMASVTKNEARLAERKRLIEQAGALVKQGPRRGPRDDGRGVDAVQRPARRGRQGPPGAGGREEARRDRGRAGEAAGGGRGHAQGVARPGRPAERAGPGRPRRTRSCSAAAG